MIVLALAAGALVGTAAWCALAAALPPPRSLRRDLAALAGRRPPTARRLGWRPAARQLALRLGAVGTEGRVGADLAITDTAPERFALERCLAAAAFSSLPLLVAVVVVPAGLALSAGLLGTAAVTLAVGGFFLPVAILRSRATERRREARVLLAAYLEVVAILLAGGTGAAGALADAAETGEGWLFARLRRAIAAAATANRSPWAEIAATAERLGLAELAELASAVTLAGEAGAGVRDTLLAKAETFRAKALADATAAAKANTELLAIPTVAMLCGFVALVGFPAFYRFLIL